MPDSQVAIVPEAGRSEVVKEGPRGEEAAREAPRATSARARLGFWLGLGSRR
jgi:hypothetical protein